MFDELTGRLKGHGYGPREWVPLDSLLLYSRMTLHVNACSNESKEERRRKWYMAHQMIFRSE
jgi:hypothetical protein